MYNKNHLDVFIQSLAETGTWRGQNAKDWYSYISDDVSDLLDHTFVRHDFLNDNRTNKLSNRELSIAILSWGAMNRKHGSTLFRHEDWLQLVTDIRNDRVDRKDAYQSFKALRSQKRLTGMGPAYYTKLICFLNRDLKGYIMDQWSAKSINLLLNRPLVALTSSGMVSDSNSADTYEEFCQCIESLSKIIQKNPLETEEALFSFGGRRKGMWRKYVIDNQITKTKSSKMNHVKTSGGYKINNETEKINMIPIEYETALQFFNEHPITMPTLGRRVQIRVYRNGDNLRLINSSDNDYNIGRRVWGLVMARLEKLPPENRDTAKYYTRGDEEPYWAGCPNQVLSVYIPAIVRYISIQNEC
jgi:hypothetical protein